MIKNINIRFNLGKEEHRKAWDYLQTMDKAAEKSYSKVIIKSLIRYFENAENKVGLPEGYWGRLRREMEELLRGQGAIISAGTELDLPEDTNKNLAEKTDNYLPEISEDVMDALEDLF